MPVEFNEAQLAELLDKKMAEKFDKPIEDIKKGLENAERRRNDEEATLKAQIAEKAEQDVETKMQKAWKPWIGKSNESELGFAGLRAARAIRANACAKLSNMSPVEVAQSWGDEWLAKDIDARQKALTSQQLTSGGAIVPDRYSNEIIEILRSAVVMERMGARRVPLPNGSLTLPRHTTTTTGDWVAENANATASDPALDQIQLVARKLRTITATSNDLLRLSDPSADVWIRDDIVAQMARTTDLQFLRGTGAANTPKGLRYQVQTGNVSGITQAGSTSTLAEVVEDLFNMIEDVEGNDVDITTGGWIMTTRTKSGLSKRLNSNGFFVFFDELNRNSLLGFPVFTTNQIPKNLTDGGGSDETEVYFVAANEMLIGDAMGLEVKFHPDGSYHDGSNVQSGISRDESVFAATRMVDFGLRHVESGAVRHSVDWYDI